MSKKVKTLRFFKAVALLVVYFLVSNTIFIRSVSQEVFLAYGFPMIFGMLTSLMFLYLFEHEDFFKFAKELEKLEEAREKKFVARFSRHSRLFTTVAIGVVCGPVFSALSAHLLVPKYRYKYLLVMFISVPSTILWVGGARGLFNFFL